MIHLAIIAQLTLNDAVSRALNQYPAVAAARAARDRTLADAGEARAATLPRLTLDATATQNQLPGLVYPLHGLPTPANPGATPVFDRTLFQGTAFVSWTFFDFGARSGRVRAARSLAGASDAALSAAQQLTIARTATAYLRVLTLRQTLAAQDQRLTALTAELSRTRALLAEGKIARVNVLRADAARARATADRSAVTGQLRVAEQDLANLIGTRPDSLAPVALADTAAPDAPEPAGTEIAEAENRLRAAQSAAAAARATRYPELRLLAGIVDRGSPSSALKAEWQAGLGVSYALYTGGQRASQVARADADARAASEQLRLARLNTTQNIERALASIGEAHARVDALRSAVAQSDTVASIELTSINVGSGTQTDYLDALSQALTARSSLIEARHAEIAARIELARVAGELSPDWLARHLEQNR